MLYFARRVFFFWFSDFSFSMHKRITLKIPIVSNRCPAVAVITHAHAIPAPIGIVVISLYQYSHIVTAYSVDTSGMIWAMLNNYFKYSIRVRMFGSHKCQNCRALWFYYCARCGVLWALFEIRQRVYLSETRDLFQHTHKKFVLVRLICYAAITILYYIHTLRMCVRAKAKKKLVIYNIFWPEMFAYIFIHVPHINKTIVTQIYPHRSIQIKCRMLYFPVFSGCWEIYHFSFHLTFFRCALA